MSQTKNTILNVYVNNVIVRVKPEITVFQACEKIGIELPRFCYHELLNIAGNCRICIVEIEKIPKPQVACSLPVIDNIKIYTNSPVALKAREGVIEFLLLNHPLDCPICDQAGECDLQNHYISHGSSRGRFFNFKRSVPDKNFGLLVKTVITRCIHCTRCVRFAIDVAGIKNLGVVKRGVNIEINTFSLESFNSEVSANVIDLCPVGALTDKLQIFKYRPWETSKFESIDVSDNLGSHIIVETKNNLPVKVTPRPCTRINEEWITDKARVSYVGFRLNRLFEYAYLIENNYWEIDYVKLIKIAGIFINIRKRGEIIFGRTTDFLNLCYGIYFCKKYGWEFNSENSHYSYPFQPNIFQSTITLIDISQIKSCFIIGINLRAESSLVNLRLNKQNITQNLNVFYLGCASDFQYKAKQLGLNLSNFFKAINGISTYSKQFFQNSIIIYGDTLSRRLDSHSGLVLNIFSQYLKKLLSINILQLSIGANSTGISFWGFPRRKKVSEKLRKETSHYVLGIQDRYALENIKANPILYENSHYDYSDLNAEFLIPIRTAYEYSNGFINFEGTIQESLRLDKSVVISLGFLGIHEIPYCLELRKHLEHFQFNSKSTYEISKVGFLQVKFYITPLKTLFIDFYRTDIVSINNTILNKISGVLNKNFWNFLTIYKL